MEGRGRLRWVLAAAGGVLVAAVVVLVVLYVRSGAREVTVDEVTAPTGSTLPTTPAVLRPEQGVYAYEGSGADRLDKPPKEQTQGPQIPGTVTHREDGCWTLRMDYSSNHWQTWVYCPRPDGGLDEKGGETYQRWDFGAFAFDSLSTFTCSDAVTIRGDQEPGDTWEQTCSGTSSSTDGEAVSSGPYTFVGAETLAVGGEEVPALRYRRERTMSGAQRGTERSEVWFAAETGMPLRNERSITASTDTVIGEVTYTEQAEFRLTSLTPRA
jgi:hypothetical protein